MFLRAKLRGFCISCQRQLPPKINEVLCPVGEGDMSPVHRTGKLSFQEACHRSLRTRTAAEARTSVLVSDNYNYQT